MEITVQSIHFDADQKLLDFVNKKIAKIERFFNRVTQIEIYLKLDAKNGGIRNKVAEIKVNIPGKTIFSKEHSFSFEDSVEKALEHTVQQVKKYKEKSRS